MKLYLLSRLSIGLLALLETSSGQSNYQNSPTIEYEEKPQITWLHEKSLLFDWLDQQIIIGKNINSKGMYNKMFLVIAEYFISWNIYLSPYFQLI